VFFIQPNAMIVIHEHKDNGRVMVKWAVDEKIWGYSAKKFKGRIIKNMRINIISVPFSLSRRVYDTSFLRVLMTFVTAVSSVLLIFQILIEGTMTTTKIINQDLEKMDVDGSNVENKLVIIFMALY